MDPPAMLDPIIMTLSHLYQKPVFLDPLDADPDDNGKRADHKIVVSKLINIVENKCSRQTRVIKVRHFPNSGFLKFKDWLIDETWQPIYEETSAHEKARLFQTMLVGKIDEIFPEKSRKIQSDDQPWISQKLKKMDRRRKRIYRKERRSIKWKKFDKLFKKEVKSGKANFYKKSVEELKQKKPGQWYSFLKKISLYDQMKNDQPMVDEISHLSDQQQAERIAEQFASIQNEYESIQKDDISIPHYDETQVPQFSPSQVWFALSRQDASKATVPGDIPAKLNKQFAAYLAEPLKDIFITSLRRGKYPEIYRYLNIDFDLT